MDGIYKGTVRQYPSSTKTIGIFLILETDGVDSCKHIDSLIRTQKDNPPFLKLLTTIPVNN
jgi:hypothetical protein